MIVMQPHCAGTHIIAFVMQAKAAYAAFLQLVRDSYQSDKVADGEFGAMMDVSLVNDGPVTCASHLL
jgi:D-aminoacyl-tRNA deacylase